MKLYLRAEKTEEQRNKKISDKKSGSCAFRKVKMVAPIAGWHRQADGELSSRKTPHGHLAHWWSARSLWHLTGDESKLELWPTARLASHPLFHRLRGRTVTISFLRAAPGISTHFLGSNADSETACHSAAIARGREDRSSRHLFTKRTFYTTGALSSRQLITHRARCLPPKYLECPRLQPQNKQFCTPS